MKKVFVAILAVLVVAGAGWYAFSKYLVSKLDGTGGMSAPQEHVLQYSSEDGVSFMYKDTYELSSHTEGNGERSWDVLVLLPKGYVPPQDGEGPPAIALGVFENQEGLSLERWVKGDARSNWKQAAADATLVPTTLGGAEALSYRYSGLYETDVVVAAKNGKIFMFSANWLSRTDATLQDFELLLGTVQFVNGQ